MKPKLLLIGLLLLSLFLVSGCLNYKDIEEATGQDGVYYFETFEEKTENSGFCIYYLDKVYQIDCNGLRAYPPYDESKKEHPNWKICKEIFFKCTERWRK